MPQSLRTVFIGFGFIVLALCVPVAAKLIWDIPPADMLRDTASVLDGPAYAGILSTLGFLLWTATATICLFVAAVQPYARAFWLYAATITLILLADDWLMLHENAPSYIGVSEHVIYSVYAIAMAYYVIHFRQILLRAEYLLLLSAFVCFAGSLVVDALDGVVYFPGFYIVEDGFKMFGIMGWLLFHWRLGLSFMAECAGGVASSGAGHSVRNGDSAHPR